MPIPQTQIGVIGAIGAIGVIGWGKTDNPYYPHNPYKKVESLQLSTPNLLSRVPHDARLRIPLREWLWLEVGVAEGDYTLHAPLGRYVEE